MQNPDETLADLKACLKAILVQFKREPAVERCVKYVVRLTTHGALPLPGKPRLCPALRSSKAGKGSKKRRQTSFLTFLR